MGETRIISAHALVADFTLLLDEVPDAGEICVELSRGLELDEVIALWLSFDDYRRRPGFTLSASLLGTIIATELGLTGEFDE